MSIFLIGLVIGIFAGGAGGYLWGAKVYSKAEGVIGALKK